MGACCRSPWRKSCRSEEVLWHCTRAKTELVNLFEAGVLAAADHVLVPNTCCMGLCAFDTQISPYDSGHMRKGEWFWNNFSLNANLKLNSPGLVVQAAPALGTGLGGEAAACQRLCRCSTGSNDGMGVLGAHDNLSRHRLADLTSPLSLLLRLLALKEGNLNARIMCSRQYGLW